MKKYRVKIVGKTPYMQNRMDDVSLDEWEKNRGALIERTDVAKKDFQRADMAAYSDKEGYYIPSEHIKGALINGGVFKKSKVGNARKTMKNIVAAMFSLEEEKIRLPSFDEVDKRSAINHSSRVRVIVIRPRWNKWDAVFTLCIDNDTLTEESIQDIIAAAGDYVGIGSFRPTQNGSFGRFNLAEFSEIKEEIVP